MICSQYLRKHCALQRGRRGRDGIVRRVRLMDWMGLDGPVDEGLCTLVPQLTPIFGRCLDIGRGDIRNVDGFIERVSGLTRT